MIQPLYKNKMCYALIGILLTSFLSGCGQSNTSTVMSIEKPIYQKAGYDTAIVEKGDIEPIITLTLSPEIVQKIDYSVEEENLEVEEIFVSAGEKVTAGQVLVTFKAEDIRKKIDQYQDEVEKNHLLLDHYTRLANVDKKKDYKVEIQKLTDNVELSQLFLDEEIQRLNDCNLIAEQNGTISYISTVLLDGYVAPSTCLVTEICGKGTYSTETDDDYDYQIGDIFTAKNDMTECQMKIIDIQSADTEEDKNIKKIIFEPSESIVDETGQEFKIDINKGVRKNVVYVRARAVQNKEDKYFVYVLSKDGFLDAVYVEPGEQVDDFVVIKQGLNGGEEVVLK